VDLSDSENDNSLTLQYNELSKSNNENDFITTAENIDISQCIKNEELKTEVEDNLLASTNSFDSFEYKENCNSNSSNFSVCNEEIPVENLDSNVISATSKLNR
jgi:hypothetical protein